MKNIKTRDMILIIIFSAIFLSCLFSIGRYYICQNHIPCMQAYGLDFSSNSGNEARKIMGTPASVLNVEEEGRFYETYFNSVLGKEAEIELVVNALTDYFFRVNVTWQFDSEQEAQDWADKVKSEVRKTCFIPFVPQEKTNNSNEWECSLGSLRCKIYIRGTYVTYSATDVS